jgi:hypothetical protein
MVEDHVDLQVHRPAQEEIDEWGAEDLTMERLRSDGVLQ